MEPEDSVFQKSDFKEDSLLSYGFEKKGEEFIYEKEFFPGFKAELHVVDNKIEGKVIELALDEEYTNFRSENIYGDFVNQVREAYIALLKDIRKNCCINHLFRQAQSNRIASYIEKTYKEPPIFKFQNDNDDAVFENKETHLWYAVILLAPKARIRGEGKGKEEVLDLKLDPEEITELLKKKGYVLCHHMNKKSWISLLLDDSLPDEEIYTRIEESRKYSEPKKPEPKKKPV